MCKSRLHVRVKTRSRRNLDLPVSQLKYPALDVHRTGQQLGNPLLWETGEGVGTDDYGNR